MIRRRQNITTPMTVIALFATLSETSAAVSLPFLGNDERELYIWFLITFPFCLLLLFFATLNFNYRSLYAPSVFEREPYFVKVMNHGAGKCAPTGTNRTPENVTTRHIELPERLKNLHIVDTRSMIRKIEFHELLKRIRRSKGDSTQMVVFLISAETEDLLEASAVKFFRHVKKRGSAPFWIAYNLNSRCVTLIDRSLREDVQRPAAVEDQWREAEGK